MSEGQRKQIKISDVIHLLDDGNTREQIAEALDLNTTEIKALFEHPKLKGRRAKKKKELSFEIVDDLIADEPQSNVEEGRPSSQNFFEEEQEETPMISQDEEVDGEMSQEDDSEESEFLEEEVTQENNQ